MEVSRDKIVNKSPQKIRVDFIPDKTKLLPIVNRDQTHPVPTSHLGESVDPTNVTDVAEKAAKFYEGVRRNGCVRWQIESACSGLG